MHHPVRVWRSTAGALAVMVAVGLVVAVGPPSPTASAFALTANWVELSPATSPPPRTGASMAYDAATGQTVLFGGDEIIDGSATLLSDTWTWDGSTWTERFPADSPPARYGAATAYDAATGDVVLFGGLSADGDLSDTWTWNGSNWTEPVPKTSPPARYTASMADDAVTGDVVLFGGLSGRTALADTWTWNGSTWAQHYPGAKPSARDAASLSDDVATGEPVLFGGDGAAGALADTWAWTGSTWVSESPVSSPPARYGAAEAYDPGSGDVVLYGGYGGGPSDQSDMWEWTGTTWNEQFPSTSPGPRRYATMDYDAATGSMVLFGGDPGGMTPSSLADTWIWGSEGTFTDSPSSQSIIVGSPETATAVVTGNVGVGVPTGTITFYTCGPTATPTPCTSSAVALGGPVALTAGAGDAASVTSPLFTALSPGYWCFTAAYSGDSDYAPATDTTDGCFLVDPPMATTPAAATVVVGHGDSDGATVYGTATGGSPTGDVSFSVCGPTATPAPCTSGGDPLGAPVPLAPGPSDTATAVSPVFTPPAPGDWCFAGSYGGDGTYAPASDTTTDECVVATPDFVTTAADPAVGLNTPDTGVGTVTGNTSAGVPTGTVTFYVCGPTPVPTPCTSQSDPVGAPVPLALVAGDTAAATSPDFIPTALGDWCFAGYYGGDGDYPESADITTDGCFDAVAVAPSFTSAAATTGTARQAFTFAVTTTGAPAPTITASHLPAWLVLVDNHDGTATLEATTPRRGVHRFTLESTNSAGSSTQSFTLTVARRTAP